MISIIILSYNTHDLLRNCLKSLFLHNKKDVIEVIVVDNASHDESVKMVKKEFPLVMVIENKENVGFAKGCNIGANQAKGEYLFFLNSDTEFKFDNTLSELIELIQDKKVGAVGGMMLNPDTSYQRTFGSFYTLSHVSKMLFLGEKSELSSQEYTNVQEVDWVSGGCMLVKKDVFTQIGGFDERFFMYVEDVDICYRIKQQGFRIVVDPKIHILHIGHGSSNRTFAITHIYKGLTLFYKKHQSSVEYFSLLALLYLKAWLVIFFATIKGDKELSQRYSKALSSI
jgi:GT2 family glycosyltransferase